MIRVALVEDDAAYREQLTGYLRQYEREQGEKFHLSVFTDGDEIVEGYKAVYDIILMDIEMQFMDGITAAERIREYDSEVVIMFITNMPQYVMKGYLVDALDYVLKPISYYAFSQKSMNERRYSIKKNGGHPAALFCCSDFLYGAY